MKWTDLTTNELEDFVLMAKLLQKGEITAGRFVVFMNNLEKQVSKRERIHVKL